MFSTQTYLTLPLNYPLMTGRVVVVSDIHLGIEESDEEEFRRFVEQEIPRLRPDVFVIAGDFIDLWRRGIESVFTEHAELISSISELDRDIEVKVIAGNHDWRLVDSNRSEDPWNVSTEFNFESGGDEFRVVHGHQYDPSNAGSISNRLLCLTNDKSARRIDSFYDTVIENTVLLRELSKREPFIPRPSLSQIASFSNPNRFTSKELDDRVGRIENRAVELNERYVIFGHTHRPKVEKDFANSGAWTTDENTYILIDNGSVEKFTFGD